MNGIEGHEGLFAHGGQSLVGCVCGWVITGTTNPQRANRLAAHVAEVVRAEERENAAVLFERWHDGFDARTADDLLAAIRSGERPPQPIKEGVEVNVEGLWWVYRVCAIEEDQAALRSVRDEDGYPYDDAFLWKPLSELTVVADQ